MITKLKLFFYCKNCSHLSRMHALLCTFLYPLSLLPVYGRGLTSNFFLLASWHWSSLPVMAAQLLTELEFTMIVILRYNEICQKFKKLTFWQQHKTLVLGKSSYLIVFLALLRVNLKKLLKLSFNIKFWPENYNLLILLVKFDPRILKSFAIAQKFFQEKTRLYTAYIYGNSKYYGFIMK